MVNPTCFKCKKKKVNEPMLPEGQSDCPYEVGEEIIYKDGDHVEKGVIEAIKSQPDNNYPLFSIKFSDNREADAQFDQLATNDETDVGQIPISADELIEQCKHLSVEDIKRLKSPQPLSDLEIAWRKLHDRHGHIPYPEMDRLVEAGILPQRFECLRGKHVFCPSCIFGRMRKRPWRTKGKYKSIRKANQKYPGAKVSADQLVVAQPGLVPRMDGRHTNDRVVGATGFLDHYSGYSYSSLQTSLDGEQTVAAKLSFEAHSESHGVDVKSYRAV